MRQQEITKGGGAGASAPHPLNIEISPFQVTLEAIVTGTINYNIQYTKDKVQAAGYVAASGNWRSLTGMTGATASAEATLISPVTAVRILQNSGAGSVTLQIIEAGFR